MKPFRPVMLLWLPVGVLAILILTLSQCLGWFIWLLATVQEFLDTVESKLCDGMAAIDSDTAGELPPKITRSKP